MASSRLAEVPDLAAWPGVVIGDYPTESAEAVLDAASAYVLNEAGRAWTAETVPPAAKAVVVQVAARAWRNPQCLQALTTGPFSEQFAAVVADALYLTASDRAVITRATARPKLWTQGTTRGECGLWETAFVPVVGGEPFPLDSWGNL